MALENTEHACDGNRSSVVSVAAICVLLSVQVIFAVHPSRGGDSTVNSALKIFGSSPAVLGVKVGVPEIEIDEINFVLSVLKRWVAFVDPKLAETAIFVALPAGAVVPLSVPPGCVPVTGAEGGQTAESDSAAATSSQDLLLTQDSCASDTETAQADVHA